MTYRRSLAVALVASTLIGACNRQPAAPPAPPAPPADAWATVDGRNIMAAEVDNAFQRTRDLTATLSPEQTHAAKMSLLEDLITQDLLLAKARTLMIDATQAEVDKAVSDAQANVTGEQFQQELSKRGLTTQDLQASLRRDLIVQKVLENEVTAKVAVTEAEITDFFNANRAQFNLAEAGYRLADRRHAGPRAAADQRLRR
jgi:peptidyl-prolyl cis-trans isomerase SurA